MKKKLFIFYVTVFLVFISSFTGVRYILPVMSTAVYIEDFSLEPFDATVQGMSVYGKTQGSVMTLNRSDLCCEATFSKTLADVASTDGFLTVTDSESNPLYRYVGEKTAKYAYKNVDSGILSVTVIDDSEGGSLCVISRAQTPEDAKLFENIILSISFS